MNYLISDLHLGHVNIVDYCDRPLDSVAEMNETLFENWNATIDPGDEVLYGGDLTVSWAETHPLDWLDGLDGDLVYYDAPKECEPGEGEGKFLREKSSGRGPTVVEAADGERLEYDTCWRPPGVGLAALGGFITGLISAGLPEIVTTQLIVRCRVPPRVAVATSVFTLAIAAVAGALVHALTATPAWWVVAWSIPWVLVGSAIGSRVGRYIPSELMETGLGVMFALVGSIVLALEFVV